MSVSACSRRFSGSVRPRVHSVTTSGGQPLGLRPSYTFPSVEAIPQDTLIPRTNAQDITSEDAFSLTTSAGWKKVAAFATLGRVRPTRLMQQDEIDGA